MKKVVIIISVLMATTTGIFAQFNKVKHANNQQIEDFFKTKTMVVLDANPFSGWNIAIKEAVEKYWTITPFEIITAEQFDRLRGNPELSFISKPNVQLKRDMQRARRVYYLYMDVMIGADVKRVEELPLLLSIPLAYTGVDEEDYVEKLPLMILFAQIHINNLRAASNPRSLRKLKNYNKTNAILLKDMTLLVQESDLSPEVNTLEKIRQVYPGVVKIVSLDELSEAISSRTPNTAVLHQVGPSEEEADGRSYRQIYGAEDGKLYFFSSHRIKARRPQGMLARDFRAIRGKWF